MKVTTFLLMMIYIWFIREARVVNTKPTTYIDTMIWQRPTLVAEKEEPLN